MSSTPHDITVALKKFTLNTKLEVLLAKLPIKIEMTMTYFFKTMTPTLKKINITGIILYENLVQDFRFLYNIFLIFI